MTKKLDPIEAAAERFRHYTHRAGEPPFEDMEEGDRAAIIRGVGSVIATYLRAAAEDEGLCLRVWRAVSSEHSDDFPFLGRAAILALAEHVEAGRGA